MKHTFKATVGEKFGVKCFTLINPSFYDYFQITELAPAGDRIEQMRNRRPNVRAEMSVAFYVESDPNPGWASPICEYDPGSILVEATSDDDIVLVTIDDSNRVCPIDGQTRRGGVGRLVQKAQDNNDQKLIDWLKACKSGIDLIEFVDNATSLKRFTDMNTSRAADAGYLKLTSDSSKYARIQYIFANSKYFNGHRVAMCADDFKADQKYMMHFNQLFTNTRDLVKHCEKQNVPLPRMVEILDYCFESLNLPDDFRFSSKTTLLLEHSTLFKNVFKGFAELVKSYPETYKRRLDAMREHACWDKNNSEFLGGYILPNKKMGTGHQESQPKYFTMYMLGVSLNKKTHSKMRNDYLAANVLPLDSTWDKEVRMNDDLPLPWVNRAARTNEEESTVYTGSTTGMSVAL